METILVASCTERFQFVINFVKFNRVRTVTGSCIDSVRVKANVSDALLRCIFISLEYSQHYRNHM